MKRYPEHQFEQQKAAVLAALGSAGIRSGSEVPRREMHPWLPLHAFDLEAALEAAGFSWPSGTAILGQLSHDGRVSPVRGVFALLSEEAWWTQAIVCRSQQAEAASARIPSIGVGALGEAARLLAGGDLPFSLAEVDEPASPQPAMEDLRIERGVLEALSAAAGVKDPILLTGPPGAGKTMLARRMASLLPPMERREAWDTGHAWSAAGLIQPFHGIPSSRPFRAPHYTVSDAGLAGIGDPPRPGEASLAHNGVLFLDELPEFGLGALKRLGGVLADGMARFPGASFCARPWVVASAMPCPCGWHGSAAGPRCSCSPEQIKRHGDRTAKCMEALGLSFTEIRTVPGMVRRP